MSTASRATWSMSQADTPELTVTHRSEMDS
jgi:hypothetical protein